MNIKTEAVVSSKNNVPRIHVKKEEEEEEDRDNDDHNSNNNYDGTATATDTAGRKSCGFEQVKVKKEEEEKEDDGNNNNDNPAGINNCSNRRKNGDDDDDYYTDWTSGNWGWILPTSTTTCSNANANASASANANANKDNHFDLIIGSDVAYRDYLHEPLIDALKEFSSSQSSSSSSTHIIPTVSLIGITMNDTKPIFFQKLIQAGFQYEKLAEHLFDTEYNTCSRQFGIFAITRTSSGTVV